MAGYVSFGIENRGGDKEVKKKLYKPTVGLYNKKS